VSISKALIETNSLCNQPKRAHGEGAEVFDLYGDGEEFEAGVRESVEAAEVFDDGDVVAEKD